MLWVATGLLFLLLVAGQGFGRAWVEEPYLLPDLDLILVLLIALFARPPRVTPLLILMVCTRASLSGTPLAAVAGAFLAIGWTLASSRHLLFRDQLPGRFILGFCGAAGLRGLLAALAHLGRGESLPGVWSLTLASGATALWFLILLPVLCRLPPFSFHLERSRV